MSKEEMLENLIEDNEELLQEVHGRSYMGTDDDMPDAFESWLAELTIEDIEIIKEKEAILEARRLTQKND